MFTSCQKYDVLPIVNFVQWVSGFSPYFGTMCVTLSFECEEVTSWCPNLHASTCIESHWEARTEQRKGHIKARPVRVSRNACSGQDRLGGIKLQLAVFVVWVSSWHASTLASHLSNIFWSEMLLFIVLVRDAKDVDSTWGSYKKGNIVSLSHNVLLLFVRPARTIVKIC